ncbi:MAG: hypothetical protein HQK52_21500 [Oligoflexia bacterium]|nr:hypothetical protein [Oligoflexia bacterium]
MKFVIHRKCSLFFLLLVTFLIISSVEGVFAEEAAVAIDTTAPAPSEQKQTVSEHDLYFDMGSSWAYLGPINFYNFKPENFGAGYAARGRFFQDKYNLSHQLHLRHLEIPSEYGASDQKLTRYNYNAKLFTDRLAEHLVVNTKVDFYREQWAKNKGINLRLRFTPIGADYFHGPTTKFTKFFPLTSIGIGYHPTYEFLNYNLVNATGNKTESKSAEYLMHNIRLSLLLTFSSEIYLFEVFNYSLVSNLKTGEAKSDYNEISNSLELFYKFNQNFSVYYKNDFISQKRRSLTFGLKNSMMEQSFNLAYIF